ncbi:MAG: hypothetical protein PWQ22_26 [Archaeoglobaceae archaeon]|nr:hypothetical protein [Archaeoglobaceae archaeon]MDK2875616.1 hypothetical protein [Archaeoglobaceae archaeon]
MQEQNGIKEAELGRKELLQTEKVIGIIEEIDGMKKNVALEICSETCHFTIPLSRMFKKVYTVVMSYELAEEIHEKLKKEGIRNVGIIVASEPIEIDFKIDLALLSHVLSSQNSKNYLCFAKNAEFVVLVDEKRTDIQFFEGFEVLRSCELPLRHMVLKRKRI